MPCAGALKFKDRFEQAMAAHEKLLAANEAAEGDEGLLTALQPELLLAVSHAAELSLPSMPDLAPLCAQEPCSSMKTSLEPPARSGS